MRKWFILKRKMDEGMNDTLAEGEKDVRQRWMSKSGLTLLIWVACAGYVAAVQIFEWAFVLNKHFVIFAASVAAIFICPIMLFFEWRTMRRELEEVRSSDG